MKILLQRVLSASVKVKQRTIGNIEKGLLLYICFESTDDIKKVHQAVEKLCKLRIFEDENEKMNLNILQAQGSILSVSQFTLSWDGKKGHRPSFDKSLDPNLAKILYRSFNDLVEEQGINLEKGSFGAQMEVLSINDGPVTFFLEF